ncbi:putative cytochrome c-like protein [Marinibacterium anthonyi]|nr:putative cytochrome c-like protein [Marinibacterium anthonyi]
MQRGAGPFFGPYIGPRQPSFAPGCPARGQMKATLLLVASLLVYALSLGAGMWMLKDRIDPQASFVQEGRAVYADNCAGCHKIRLESLPDWHSSDARGHPDLPQFDPALHSWKLPDGMMVRIVRAPTGERNGPATTVHGYGKGLSESDLEAVLAYVKLAWPEKLHLFQFDPARP